MELNNISQSSDYQYRMLCFVHLSIIAILKYFVNSLFSITLLKRGTKMLGEQIKDLRQSRQLSQVELAHALNVSKQSVSNWENNNILPSIEMLKKIAIYFSCTTDYLLELDNNRLFLEVTELTPSELAHIQAIVNDIRILKSQRLKDGDGD